MYVILQAKAPWIKHFVNADDEDLHILLGYRIVLMLNLYFLIEQNTLHGHICYRSKAVILGGIHLSNVGNLDIEQHHRRRILEGCCKLIPSLKVIDN